MQHFEEVLSKNLFAAFPNSGRVTSDYQHASNLLISKKRTNVGGCLSTTFKSFFLNQAPITT